MLDFCEHVNRRKKMKKLNLTLITLSLNANQLLKQNKQ